MWHKNCTGKFLPAIANCLFDELPNYALCMAVTVPSYHFDKMVDFLLFRNINRVIGLYINNQSDNFKFQTSSY